MALEQVFECQRTLRRLRSGPLGKLLEGFCNWLLEHGFSRWTIRMWSNGVKSFLLTLRIVLIILAHGKTPKNPISRSLLPCHLPWK
jgi:hypothetical protein